MPADMNCTERHCLKVSKCFRLENHAAGTWFAPTDAADAQGINQMNPLTYLTYALRNVRNRSVQLPTPDDFTTSGTVLNG